jgi:predicted patatin/cPLA2 family phospholipase
MDTLENRIQQREKKYLQSVETILKQESSERTKIALINKEHIRCILAIEDMVADAQFEPAPTG